jgi:hypothetical protein
MNRLIIAIVFICLVFIGSLLPSEVSANAQELQIVSAEMRAIPDAPPQRDYELIIKFNRPLTNSELYPARFLRYTYGVKFWLTSRTGWKREPYDIQGLQSGLAREDNLSYWLTGETLYHPAGRSGYNKEVDEAFRKGNIESLSIELYKQDKNDPDSEYQLIQSFAAKNL